MSTKSQAMRGTKKGKASSRRAAPRSQHVVPEHKGWAVKAAGGTRATRTYDTQAEAIEAAKKAAGKGGEVVIHGRDGRTRQTVSTSRADELMMRVWKDAHAGSPLKNSGTRKVG